MASWPSARACPQLHGLVVHPRADPGLRRIIDDTCDTDGSELIVVAEIESPPNVNRAVEADLGGTILPLGAVADDVAAGRAESGAVLRVVCHVLRQIVEDGRWPA